MGFSLKTSFLSSVLTLKICSDDEQRNSRRRSDLERGRRHNGDHYLRLFLGARRGWRPWIAIGVDDAFDAIAIIKACSLYSL